MNEVINHSGDWLPIVFIGLMGLAVLAYAILDGYDLGVGILLPMGEEDERQRDTMIASIGPFWDANETWLVLAVGLLLIAFPAAHSLILMHLYIPVAIMLTGLIMRGVAFDFRAKAAVDHKLAWDRTFKIGSLITTLTQGYMLGQYVMGFDQSLSAVLFCGLSAFGVTAAYCYIGSAWLVLKTDAVLQSRAVGWTRKAGRASLLGVVAVCVINPLVNPGVFDRWFTFPLVMFVLLIPTLCFIGFIINSTNITSGKVKQRSNTPGFTFPLVMFVLLIPTLCFIGFIINDLLLRRLPKERDRHSALPFSLVVVIFVLCFSGLGFSFFPDIVPGQMNIWEAASARESLQFILMGAVIVVPVILMYTIFSYRVFHGKATDLHYH